MTNQISIYNFNQNQVRTTIINNNPWFCLADCAKALDIKNPATSVKFDKKGVGKTYTLTNGGQQEIKIINEPNLYRLIFRSNKPQAQTFANWVYEEVLPAIRKTGAYIPEPLVPVSAHMRRLPSGPREIKLSEKARSEIGGIVKNCCAVAIKEVLETSHINPALPFDPVPYDADEFQIADWVNEATFLPDKIVEELKRIELASEKLAKKSTNPNITKLWRFFKALSALIIRYDTVRAETIFSAEMMRKNEKYSKDNMADEINRLNTIVRASFITA